MPKLSVSCVPVPSVTKQDVLHHLGERRLTDLYQMVHMVGHQHIRIQSISKSPLTLFKQIQITPAVLIILKNGLPVIASTHDMIKSPSEMYPWLSGHDGTTVGEEESQLGMPDPNFDPNFTNINLEFEGKISACVRFCKN